MKFERQHDFITDVEIQLNQMRSCNDFIIYWFKVQSHPGSIFIHLRVKGDRILKVRVNSYKGYYPALSPSDLKNFLNKLITEGILSYYKDCKSVKLKTKFN